MPDITSIQLPLMLDQHWPQLDLGTKVVYPDYQGGSIMNVPDSLCHWFGVPELASRPLKPDLTPFNDRTFQRIVVILMDALSLQRLRRWMAEDESLVWNRFQENGMLAPLTSVVPCTTSAALTTFWTGRSPAEHGIAGYELWLKEYGLVANMITHSPMSFANGASSLEQAGFKPETYLTYPTLGSHLIAQGVHTYLFQHKSLRSSGLSRLFLKDINIYGLTTATNLWIDLRNLINNHPAERQLIWVYWGEVDHFSHNYGPDDERPYNEFLSFSQAFEKLALAKLSPQALKKTLFVLTADHGQINTTPAPQYDLNNHPELIRQLHMWPTGEHRLAYLFVRSANLDSVRKYIDRTWPGQFTLIDPVQAVQAGLYGPGEIHPMLLERLGDLIVAAREDAYLWWSNRENVLKGRHGGLSAEEMLVPLLAGQA